MRSTVAFALLFATLLGAVANAQSPPADDPDARTDVTDLWRKFRKRPADAPRDDRRRMLFVAPVLGADPTYGFTFGATAHLVFRLGQSADTRLSSSATTLRFSTKGRTLIKSRFAGFTERNRWFADGDNRLYFSGLDTYPLGTDAPESARVASDFHFLRLHDALYRHVGSDLYLGGGIAFDTYTKIHPAPGSESAWPTSGFVTYSAANGLPIASQRAVGLDVGARIDKREGEINPQGGWMGVLSYRTSFADFLGADSTWSKVRFEYRQYVRLTPDARHRIAFWAIGDASSNNAVTYYDLAETVGDGDGRSARGYRQGRYRGESMLYGEAEYRGPLTRNGLLGVVAFANVTTLTSRTEGLKLFDSGAPSAGGGLRVLLNKRTNTNICVDVAWGKAGSSGVYFALQDAF